MALSKQFTDSIIECKDTTTSIRNICILAHVDHGKTTIADILLSTNNLISKRSAGQIRYLDDRRDEQERGITMKSSAVSLLHVDEKAKRNFVINLIDTPGHIDFSTEVTAAIRISDGAIIVVDIVEGMCVQTKDAIKQAFDEHINMILVINKLDRLIVELKKTVDDIFQIIIRVIEDCNAYIAQLCRYDLTSDKSENDALFSPEKGNIIFASGLDGWAFTTLDIAELFATVLNNETPESINSKMWNFDYYVDSTKNIVSGAFAKKKENIFIQLCLKTVHFVYYKLVVRMERDVLNLILNKLNIQNKTREMTHNDPKVQVRAVLQAWKPLGPCVMRQCQRKVPSPAHVSIYRLRMMFNMCRYFEDNILNEYGVNMMERLRDPSSSDTSLTVAYVSKMFCISKKNLSQNKPKVFVPSVQSREAVLAARKESMERIKELPSDDASTSESERSTTSKEEDVTDDNSIIALARVFNGELKTGQEIFVLPPNHNPSKDTDREKVVIKELYMLLGRELVLVDSVPTGNICGIGGLENSVIRTATLSNNLECLSFGDKSFVEPIVRNSIEPIDPKMMPVLRKGLKMLMQSDSCVQVSMQESGEHVLITAGDVHLAKCIEDLTTKFAKVDIHVSKPIVALKETLIKQRRILDFKGHNVECLIKEIGLNLHITIVPLPKKIIHVVENKFNILRMIEDHQQKGSGDVIMEYDNQTTERTGEKVFTNENTQRIVMKLREQMKEIFKHCYCLWSELHGNIWSVGKNRDSVNVLFNCTKNYKERHIFNILNTSDPRSCIDHCIINAFDMTCRAGPMCEEPITNCAFVITSFQLTNYDALKNMEQNQKTQFLANIPVVIKQSFREAFQKQAQRLMEPIFLTDILVNTSILGKWFFNNNVRG